MKHKTLLNKFQRDPIYHIVEVQGCTTLEKFQETVIKSVALHERTVVRATHDVGKTFIAAKIVLWFNSVFEGAKVITTAPTYNQVKRLLWSEIRAGFVKSKYPLGGEMLMTEWKVADDWFAVGFTSRNEKTEGEGQGAASGFQGFHAPFILVVFDEATGISSIMWKQLEGIMTSGFVRFLGIGNPTTKSCDFFKCFSDPAYHKIKLSCFDSPNFKANKILGMSDLIVEVDRFKELTQDNQYLELKKYKVVNQHLLTVRWVMQMVLRLGIKHPLVVSKCFGEFPEEDDNALITLGSIQLAQYRTYKPKPLDRISIGVDVARFGVDKTVITRFDGCQQTLKQTLVKRDTSEIAGELVKMINSTQSQDIHVAIDGTGIGAGVIDSLKQSRTEGLIPQKVEIRECHFGAAPGGRKGSRKETDLKGKYLNLKARIFVELAEDIKSDLCLLPTEEVYLEELPTIHYRFSRKGQYQIESKDEYRARTGRSSPDDSDSLALANFARRDESSAGNFTESLIQTGNSTIVSYSKGTAQW